MTSAGNSSHVACCLSIADIVAVLYGSVLRVRPQEPKWPDRDRLILSKGHAGAAVYAALAECGFFSPSLLEAHCQNGSPLSGHLSHRGVPGVELSTGSLGHGLPVGAGFALSARLSGADRRVFVVLGDGECDEGSNWEAALFAAHHHLGNLVAVIDCNGLQSMGSVAATLGLEPLPGKWRDFGWDVAEIDGHDHAQLLSALNSAPTATDRPLCVVARTVKGRGVSFMENSIAWHYRAPKGDDLKAALRELGVSE